jgi:predicted TPR repeat methyltransferase
LEGTGIVAKDLEGFVAKLTALGGGSGDSTEVYQEWAPTYERNMQQDYGYVAHRIAAAAFAQHCIDKAARILDLGCGTGLVGEELAGHGFTHIDGLDISPNMLAEAGAKGVYGELLIADMTGPIDLGQRRYDGAIGVGCFGGGHVGPEHLPEMIRCVRPGGLLVFYINAIPYDEDDYPAHFRRLEADGLWRLVSTEQSNYMQALERPGWTVVATR